jgi:hypothetical protein
MIGFQHCILCCSITGYLMGAVAPLQQATGLRSLTIPDLADGYSLVYLRLLTQLTELQLAPWGGDGDGEPDVGLVVGRPPRAPLADMTHLRALSLLDGIPFTLCKNSSVDEAFLPLVLPPTLTRLEVLVPVCEPGAFWRHIAACSQLVSLTVTTHYAEAAADHPSWMLCRLAGRLPHLQHLSLHGSGSREEPILPEALGLLAGTEAGQQQQWEQGWDWRDLAAPGLGDGARYNNVVVPPPNMGAFTALRTLEFANTWGYSLRCCGPHHWRTLARCRGLQQLHGLEAWAVPPAGVKFPGVTDLKLVIRGPALFAMPAVLGAFPAMEDLLLRVELPSRPEVRCRREGDENHRFIHVKLLATGFLACSCTWCHPGMLVLP